MNTHARSLAWGRPDSVLLKAAMAVTGLGMAVWLTLHMLGNLTLFAGPQIMNGYAIKLHDSGILWPLRALLIVALGVHVVCAVLTTRRAHAARPHGYRVRLRGHTSSWAARSMRVGGVLLLAYLFYHVTQIYGLGHPSFVPGDVHHNLLAIVRQPLHAVVYLAATALVSLHLAHGLASSWITLGLFAPRRERLVRRSLFAWAALVTLGFAAPVLAPYL
ncbi:MAG TPA: succinate dehydrogenase cytochrome b subunit [Polyangiales bacterium]|nr:succinate dehydrogenase cytochrome b subunit [Polyangiales bacterium]